MAVRPLYHFDDKVICWACGGEAGLARDGDVVGFGDGNGNRELACKCGHKTVFDATKSHERVADHWKQHGPILDACRQSVSDFLAQRKAGRNSRGSSRNAFLVSPPPSAAPSSEPAPAGRNLFLQAK